MSEDLALISNKYKHLNRYKDRIPCKYRLFEKNYLQVLFVDDYSRVRVKISDEDDYINASFLLHPNDSNLDGSALKRVYIATQAPIPNTFSRFWTMVLEQKVSTIVCLVDLEHRRCEKYWPDSSDPIMTLESGLTVTFISENFVNGSSEILERSFNVQLDNQNSQTVRQIHYRTWPDFGIPESFDQIKILIETINPEIYGSTSGQGLSIRNASSNIVVHCSAGIGRTGTFCVIDSIIRFLYVAKNSSTDGRDNCYGEDADILDSSSCLKLSKNSLDNNEYLLLDPVMHAILVFRSQRKGMVETSSQFDFIYRFLYAQIQNNSVL